MRIYYCLSRDNFRISSLIFIHFLFFLVLKYLFVSYCMSFYLFFITVVLSSSLIISITTSILHALPTPSQRHQFLLTHPTSAFLHFPPSAIPPPLPPTFLRPKKDGRVTIRLFFPSILSPPSCYDLDSCV